MVPVYCVENLARTGGPVALVLAFALAAGIVGAALIARRRRVALGALLLIALVPALALAPTRAEAQAHSEKECPAGYHYVAGRDTTVSAPAGSAASDGDHRFGRESGHRRARTGPGARACPAAPLGRR